MCVSLNVLQSPWHVVRDAVFAGVTVANANLPGLHGKSKLVAHTGTWCIVIQKSI